MLMLKLQYFGHLMQITDWKRPWCWERLKAGGEGDDKGWDGWMASPTWWTWVWASSWSWWWTGKPGVLQSMGSQRVRHDWATELNCSSKTDKGNLKDICLIHHHNYCHKRLCSYFQKQKRKVPYILFQFHRITKNLCSLFFIFLQFCILLFIFYFLCFIEIQFTCHKIQLYQVSNSKSFSLFTVVQPSPLSNFRTFSSYWKEISSPLTSPLALGNH